MTSKGAVLPLAVRLDTLRTLGVLPIPYGDGANLAPVGDSETSHRRLRVRWRALDAPGAPRADPWLSGEAFSSDRLADCSTVP